MELADLCLPAPTTSEGFFNWFVIVGKKAFEPFARMYQSGSY